VPSLRPTPRTSEAPPPQEGINTYRLHRPTGGRDVVSTLRERRPSAPAPSPSLHAVPPSPEPVAAPAPAELVPAPAPRARPVIEPIEPVRQRRVSQPAVELDAAPAKRNAIAAPAGRNPVATRDSIPLHDQTDIVTPPAWSPAGLRPEMRGRRRLGWGWWIALASAAAFFLASAALWAS